MADSEISTSSLNALPNAIPLIVGVTGHRDLVAEDIPRLKELVREVFRSLKTKYPHTPLVLLSPLVAGADQLVAEVALEEGVRAQLVAVLCWPVEFAADKLPRGGGLARFQELLAQAGKIVAMPLNDEGRSLAVADWATFAERQYELVGKYIARHSQLLIALWDGDALESSGTARVVQWQQDGAPAPFAASLGELDVVEGAPICHIPVRRASRTRKTETQGGCASYMYPKSSNGSAEEEVHRA